MKTVSLYQILSFKEGTGENNKEKHLGSESSDQQWNIFSVGLKQISSLFEVVFLFLWSNVYRWMTPNERSRITLLWGDWPWCVSTPVGSMIYTSSNHRQMNCLPACFPDAVPVAKNCLPTCFPARIHPAPHCCLPMKIQKLSGLLALLLHNSIA